MVMAKTNMTLKGRFLLRAKQVGTTQAEIARQMGEKPQTISKWMDRQSIPSKHLVQLSDILKCRIRWLLADDETDTRDTSPSSRLIRYIKTGRLSESDIVALWPIIEKLAVVKDGDSHV